MYKCCYQKCYFYHYRNIAAFVISTAKTSHVAGSRNLICSEAITHANVHKIDAEREICMAHGGRVASKWNLLQQHRLQQRKQKAMNLLIQSGLVASDVCSSPAGTSQ